MSRSRTFYGNVPASYRRWWLENAFPIAASKLAGADDGGGGILDRLADRDDPELVRLRDFGACWSWWRVPPIDREQWRARG